LPQSGADFLIAKIKPGGNINGGGARRIFLFPLAAGRGVIACALFY